MNPQFGQGIFQHESLEDKSNKNVQYDDDARDVKGKEEELGPLTRDQHVAHGDDMPLVNDHQLKKENHRGREVVEVTVTVSALCKLAASELGVAAAALVRADGVDPSVEELHADDGKEVVDDEKNPAIGQKAGQDVDQGIEDRSEAGETVEDLEDADDTEDHEEVQGSRRFTFANDTLVRGHQNCHSHNDGVENVPQFGDKGFEAKGI